MACSRNRQFFDSRVYNGRRDQTAAIVFAFLYIPNGKSTPPRKGHHEKSSHTIAAG